MSIVSKVKDILRPHKYKLYPLTKIGWTRSLQNLKRLGFEPKSVFDIGVAHGTWELYAIYPKAFYYLTEPVKEAFFHLEKIAKHFNGNCQIDKVALSDKNGTAVFDIRADIQGSTMLENVGEADTIRHEEVITRTFDSLYPTFPTPAFVKIDVQGAEMMVLKGMEKSLPKIDAILLEVSVLTTIKDGPEVWDVMSFMHQHGFVLADILGALRRPLDNQVSQMDLLFIKDKSELRANHHWA